jgi:beta-lactamase superfamily II metal-dependent hydrolase
VIQRLQSAGVTSIDAVLATHPDADHVGGLAAVLGTFEVGRIYVNGDPSATQTYDEFLLAAAAEPGARVMTLSRGQTVPLGGLLLLVLNPSSASGDTNNDSIVLELTCGSVSVLFTGDAELSAEQSMISAGLVTRVNVLKVGHHGSNTASSLAFVQALSPEVAIISAGRSNAYGHPAPEALARLESVGAQFEYTDTTPGDDSVTMTSDCTTFSFSIPPTSATPAPDGSATATETP